jgi:hypothetical protein
MSGFDDVFAAVDQRLTTHDGPLDDPDRLPRPCGHTTALDETHCTSCHRTWSAHAQAHCAACCRHFSSVSAFDAHQRQRNYRDSEGRWLWRVDVICHDPETLTKKDGSARLVQVEDQYGAMWALPGTWGGPDTRTTS